MSKAGCVWQISVVYDTMGCTDGRSWRQWGRAFGSASLETECIATRFHSNFYMANTRAGDVRHLSSRQQRRLSVRIGAHPVINLLPTISAKDRSVMTGTCTSPAAVIFDAETRGHPFSLNGKGSYRAGHRFLAAWRGDASTQASST